MTGPVARGEEPPALPTLLSQPLVAFTIEVDNEFERRMPHRTTSHGSTVPPGPWLVSFAMWSNCMRFVDDAGVTVAEVERLARTGTNVDGMRRWGYIVVEPDLAGRRSKQPRPDAVLRTTAAGRRAQKVWRPLGAAIEARWRERHGDDEVDQLRASLERLDAGLDLDLPDCLPILGYGLFSTNRPDGRRGTRVDHDGRSESLDALLARVLLAFAIEFEERSDVSLAICANVLRIVSEDPTPIRDLPLRSGVSKEAIAVSCGYLQRHGYAAVEQAAGPRRGKIIRLTARGRAARQTYFDLVAGIEASWRDRFGEEAITAMRGRLERLLPSLWLGLEPYPDGWRASLPSPSVLPHFPMVLHRGGFPDGS